MRFRATRSKKRSSKVSDLVHLLLLLRTNGANASYAYAPSSTTGFGTKLSAYTDFATYRDEVGCLPIDETTEGASSSFFCSICDEMRR